MTFTKQEKTVCREFTDGDWEGFAGAECWKDGAQPLVREFDDYRLAIADPGGVTLILFDEDKFYMWNVSLPSQALAMAILNGLDQHITVGKARDLGFERG